MLPPAITRSYEAATRAVAYAAAAILIALTAAVFVGVIVRYLGLFQGSLSWLVELSQFLSIWLAFIGAVVALDRGGHIAVDLLANAVQARIRPYYQLFIQASILFFLVVLSWQGAVLTGQTGFEHTPALHLPLSALYAVVPVSGTLMALLMLRAIAQTILSLGPPISSRGAAASTVADGAGANRLSRFD